jgi:hypothetical protein
MQRLDPVAQIRKVFVFDSPASRGRFHFGSILLRLAGRD